ncbi:MAG: nucleotidyltransferase domain-containing protein [Deltaproteobacteria bacterium]|nr:nucleotidyltransferase domain-containing protein [Deltaproteobacteria bacterium]
MDFVGVLDKIAERYGLIAVYAFGSRAAEVVRRARGREGAPEAPGSDVDLGVQPRKDRRLTGREKVGLTLELEALLGSHGDRVDLVVLSEAPPFWPWTSCEAS